MLTYISEFVIYFIRALRDALPKTVYCRLLIMLLGGLILWFIDFGLFQFKKQIVSTCNGLHCYLLFRLLSKLLAWDWILMCYKNCTN